MRVTKEPELRKQEILDTAPVSYTHLRRHFGTKCPEVGARPDCGKGGKLIYETISNFDSGVLRRCSFMRIEPVSYTHLDVYKRQVHGDYHFCSGVWQND